MKAKLFLATVVVFGLGISSASAQIRQNARTQRQCIQQGIRSGELTKPEAINLANDQREIRQDIRQAKSNDGVITPTERQDIREDQRQASRTIYRKKHNNRDRN
jgi:type II secretory pathway pseudopilin PulG